MEKHWRLSITRKLYHKIESLINVSLHAGLKFRYAGYNTDIQYNG